MTIMLTLTLLVEDMFCFFLFLMYVVFMAYRSGTGFFLLGSVNWGGLYMVLLHHPDGK